jgi:rhodanese-related sulfurtransferase
MTKTTEAAAAVDGAVCELPPVERAETPAVPLVSPTIAAAAVSGGALLVDVRSEGFRAKTGGLPQAIIADRTRLNEEFGLDSAEKHPEVTDHDQAIVVICGSINGSQPVAEELTRQGFRNVVHVDGAFQAWKDAGLPTTPPTEPAE